MCASRAVSRAVLGWAYSLASWAVGTLSGAVPALWLPLREHEKRLLKKEAKGERDWGSSGSAEVQRQGSILVGCVPDLFGRVSTAGGSLLEEPVSQDLDL